MPLVARRGAITVVREEGPWIIVQTLGCAICGKRHPFKLTRKQFMAWQTDTHIQDAFPELTAGERETLISGTCEPCWDRMWGQPPRA